LANHDKEIWRYQLAVVERRDATAYAYNKGIAQWMSNAESTESATSRQGSLVGKSMEVASSQAGVEIMGKPVQMVQWGREKLAYIGGRLERLQAARADTLSNAEERDVAAGSETMPASDGVNDSFSIQAKSTESQEDDIVTVNVSDLAKGAPLSSSTDLENVLAVLQERQTKVSKSPEAPLTEQFSTTPTSRLERLSFTPGKDSLRVKRRHVAGFRTIDLTRSSRVLGSANRRSSLSGRLSRLRRIRGDGHAQLGGPKRLLQHVTPDEAKDAPSISYDSGNEVQIGSINEI
jgi:hypothetical protein